MSGILHRYLTHQAERRPEATALVLRHERMSYGQLETAASKLAHLLIALGCQKGDRIGFVMPKSFAPVISLLGILKAGGIYVPIDPVGPAARVEKILETCGIRWLLAAPAAAPLLDELVEKPKWRAALRIGCLEKEILEGRNFRAVFDLHHLAIFPAGPVNRRVKPEDPAHILFTSGSTGAPKGVVITHSNVAQFVQWANRYFGAGPDDRNSGHSPLHFDLSTYDLFGTFAAGAQLHLVPPELNLLPHKLTEFIRNARLTQWFSVPSILAYMAKFDAVHLNDFPALKRVLWCGEVIPTPALMYWMKHLPRVRFTNLYGPTEATIASSYYTVTRCPEHEKSPIPIGTACDGEELLVLDDKLEPVPTGAVGDLYIRGGGLSPGYWNAPELTSRAFFPYPPGPRPADRIYRTGDLARRGADGLFYFIGRSDTQIKSRGYRIELGEIEAALNTLPSLRESAVVAVPTNGFEGVSVCCAYSPVPGLQVDPTTLRKELSNLLPAYMLPARWLALAQLPRTTNHKVDRRLLQEDFQRGLNEELRSHEAQAS